MNGTYLILGLFLCSLGSVLSQIAGGSQGVGNLIGSTPEVAPQRFYNVPQVDNEWEKMGATFSIETWLWWATPTDNADGNWTNSPDQMEFDSVISRHPGLNWLNEYAHFNLQVTRTTVGATLVFWAGCGCVSPPAFSPENLPTCGFAYVLPSDSTDLAANQRFYLKPQQWHYVAATVNGDGTTQGFTPGIANLYIDGVLLLSNSFDDIENNAFYRNPSTCAGRPIFSQTVSGTQNYQVNFGYYNNQDLGSYSGNPDYIFGFTGYVDEIRIWDTVRTTADIASTWNSIIPSTQPGLIALYNFNELVNDTTIGNSAGGGNGPVAVVGGPNGTYPPNQPNVSLILAQTVIIQGSTPKHPPVKNLVPLAGNTQKGYIISELSNPLAEYIASNETLMLDSAGHPINESVLPYQISLGNLTIEFFCTDAPCSNIPPPDQVFSFVYASVEYPSVYASVNMYVEAPCPEGFDACGVCGGDNRTCQCVIYHDFRNTRMAYILLTWSLENICSKIESTISILTEIENILADPNWNDSMIQGNYTLAYEVSYMMDFYNLCLTDYCGDVTQFIQMLDSYLVSLLPGQSFTNIKRGTNTLSSQSALAVRSM